MGRFDFTYGAYERLLENISERFRIIGPQNLIKSEIGPWCFLRHDLDNDLELALKMATIEHTMGIQSTYYLMIASSLYNCFSPENKQIVSEIIEMGHGIGLHFCLKSHGKYDSAVLEAIQRERCFLENIFDVSICTVSFHQPWQAVNSQETGVTSLDFSLQEKLGLINTYSSEDMKQAFYVSDSLMQFRNIGDPVDFFRQTEERNIQLLIHPSWYDDTWSDVESRWDRLMLIRFRRMLSEKMKHERSMNRPRKVGLL